VGRRVVWALLTVGVLLAGAGAWVTLRAREEVQDPRKPVIPTWVGKKPAPLGPRVRAQQARAGLFAELQPVKLANCEFARYGEGNDGGYLACRNLLKDVRAAYSYGISGYDGWGCAVSTEELMRRANLSAFPFFRKIDPKSGVSEHSGASFWPGLVEVHPCQRKAALRGFPDVSRDHRTFQWEAEPDV